MTDDDARFLTVVGLVKPDDEIDLFPGFVTPTAHRIEADPESPFSVELLDERGRVLHQQSVPAQELCHEGAPADGTALMGKVQLPSATSAIRIRRGQQTLLERALPNQGPQLRLTWEPPENPAGLQTITWTATHPEGVPLHALVAYSHSGDDAWQPLSLVTDAMSHDVDLDNLPGGSACRIAVICSDGFNTVQATSSAFELSPRPCQAFILSPSEGETFRPEESITLVGQGYWMEEDQPEYDDLSWWSSIDGALGRGATVTATLRVGLHTITLASGRDDRTSTSAVNISVSEGPNPPS
jgi:hypothetical protein